MTQKLREHLEALGADGRERLRRDSAKALREAWPHRHGSFRAPHVVKANVEMLRNLRSL